MLKFKKGDLVFHPFYGTGTITGIQSLEMSGAEQPYYIIDLAIGEVLMIPIKEAEDAQLHSPTSSEKISDILSATPEELADDFRHRREYLEGKINSGNPEWVCEALRDLAWRENTAQLSRGDKALMVTAKKLLSNALVRQPDLDVREASQRLEVILEQSTLAWNTSG
jgi:CarD family transcriptional regulator